jgi:hypothetical protein
LSRNENASCVCVIFLQHPDECSSDIVWFKKWEAWHRTPYIPWPRLFYSGNIYQMQEKNECGDIFSLYMKLFGAKVDVSCSMEPSGNLLAACLKFSWFLVVCFICQFVYCGTPTVVWRTQNNRIEFFSQLAHKSA